MAYLVRRSPTRIEIRESRATPRGPRSQVLASFSGALTPDVLAAAEARAARPFAPEAVRRRARLMGIPVQDRPREPEVRALLARLRRSDPLDPVLAGLLRSAVESLDASAVPESLAEVSEWVGASGAERGQALRELLDLYGQIAASRSLPRERERRRFPRFSTNPEAA